MDKIYQQQTNEITEHFIYTELAVISLGVAAISFRIGTAIQHIFNVEI